MSYASLEQVAQVLNMTPQMVNRHVKQHGMPRISRGEYDLVKCVHWYIAYKDQQIKEARRGTETEAQARQRLIIATANLREVDLAKACGDLIDIEVAQTLWQRLAVSFRNKILLLPTKLAPQVITCKDPSEAQSLMELEIHEALHDLSSGTIQSIGIRRSAGTVKVRTTTHRTASKTNRQRVVRPGENLKRGELRGTGKMENDKS